MATSRSPNGEGAMMAATSTSTFPGKETRDMSVLAKLSPPEVRKERASLERQLHQVLQERKLIQLECESAKEEVQLIREQLDAEKDERKQVMLDLVNARLQKRDLAAAVKDGDDERAERSSDLQLVNGESALVTRQNETLTQEAGALKGQLAMLSKARTLLGNQCGVALLEAKLLTQKVAEARREAKTLQGEQKQYEIEVRHLQEELGQEEVERDRLVDQLGMAKDERTQLRMAVCEGKRHQLALSSQVKLLESEQAKMHDSMKVSLSEVKYLEGKQGVLSRASQRDATKMHRLVINTKRVLKKVDIADSGRKSLQEHLDMMARVSEMDYSDAAASGAENSTHATPVIKARVKEVDAELLDSEGVEWELENLEGEESRHFGSQDLSYLMDSDGYDDDDGDNASRSIRSQISTQRRSAGNITRPGYLNRPQKKKENLSTMAGSSTAMTTSVSIDAVSEASSRPSRSASTHSSVVSSPQRLDPRDSKGQSPTKQTSRGSSKTSPTLQ